MVSGGKGQIISSRVCTRSPAVEVSISTQSRFENTGEVSDKKLRALAAFMGDDGQRMLRVAGHKTPYKRPATESDPRARIILEHYYRVAEDQKGDAFQSVLEVLQRKR